MSVLMFIRIFCSLKGNRQFTYWYTKRGWWQFRTRIPVYLDRIRWEGHLELSILGKRMRMCFEERSKEERNNEKDASRKVRHATQHFISNRERTWELIFDESLRFITWIKHYAVSIIVSLIRLQKQLLVQNRSQEIAEVAKPSQNLLDVRKLTAIILFGSQTSALCLASLRGAELGIWKSSRLNP